MPTKREAVCSGQSSPACGPAPGDPLGAGPRGAAVLWLAGPSPVRPLLSPPGRPAGWSSPAAYTGGCSCVSSNARPCPPPSDSPVNPDTPAPSAQPADSALAPQTPPESPRPLCPAPSDPPPAQDHEVPTLAGGWGCEQPKPLARRGLPTPSRLLTLGPRAAAWTPLGLSVQCAPHQRWATLLPPLSWALCAPLPPQHWGGAAEGVCAPRRLSPPICHPPPPGTRRPGGPVLPAGLGVENAGETAQSWAGRQVGDADDPSTSCTPLETSPRSSPPRGTRPQASRVPDSQGHWGFKSTVSPSHGWVEHFLMRPSHRPCRDGATEDVGLPGEAGAVLTPVCPGPMLPEHEATPTRPPGALVCLLPLLPPSCVSGRECSRWTFPNAKGGQKANPRKYSVYMLAALQRTGVNIKDRQP